MNKEIKEILINEESLRKRVVELGKELTRDYQGKDLIVVGVLKGAVVFMTDLIREINLPIALDFMSVSSYGNSTESSGIVRVLKDLDNSVEGKDILIIEDIIDTGLTLKHLINNLKNKGAKSIEICTLLDKPERRKAEIDVKYIGFKVPDVFIVGYGIDYAEKYRNLPYIGCL